MSRFARFCLPLLTLFALLLSTPARADDAFLEPDAAFKFSARMVDGHTVAVTFQIADGYYMYRERFKFSAQGAKLGALAIPAGTVHFDETFQKNVETYRKSVSMTLPVDAAGSFTLLGTGQGCSDKGLCYAPQEYKIALVGSGSVPLPVSAASATAAPGAGSPAMSTATTAAAPTTTPAQAASIGGAALEGKAAAVTPGVTIRAIPAPVTTLLAPQTVPAPASAASNEAGRLEAALKSGKLLVILPLFALLGLGLSFTPCVLPMVPILSSIIVGEGANTSRGRGLLLSLTYALGMAIVYTALGVAAGLAGEGLAAALQNPWVLGSFGLLMALLSLSMFGIYDLQVPAALQSKLSDV